MPHHVLRSLTTQLEKLANDLTPAIDATARVYGYDSPVAVGLVQLRSASESLLSACVGQILNDYTASQPDA